MTKTEKEQYGGGVSVYCWDCEVDVHGEIISIDEGVKIFNCVCPLCGIDHGPVKIYPAVNAKDE